MPSPDTASLNKDNVSTTSVAYDAMAVKWPLLHDLLGGTLAMQAAGEKWLPKEPKEEDHAYQLRLERSQLYNGYGDTIKRLTSRPFSKPVTTSVELPERLELLLANADNAGGDITQFAREVFRTMAIYGMAHILVDSPPDPVAGTKTLADEKAAGTHPYFVLIQPPQLLGYKTRVGSDGLPELSQIRIYERVIEDDGDYASKEIEQIRVYNADGTWEIHRKRTEEDKSIRWVLHEDGEHSYPGIPLVTVYADKIGYMQANPPLEDLAWVNLEHWQSRSDQKNILRIARVGILFASGFLTEEIEAGITVGPSRMVASTNPDAKLQYVEHTGKAIESGETDIAHLEERMEVLGQQPFLQRSGAQTATGKAIDESRTQSDIQAWIQSLENGLWYAFHRAAVWLGEKIPKGFSVNVFSDFSISWGRTEDVKALQAMRDKRQITQQTFLTEVKRRGLLGDSVDVEREVAYTQAETSGPSMDLEGYIPPDDEQETDGEEEPVDASPLDATEQTEE